MHACGKRALESPEVDVVGKLVCIAVVYEELLQLGRCPDIVHSFPKSSLLVHLTAITKVKGIVKFWMLHDEVLRLYASLVVVQITKSDLS